MTHNVTGKSGSVSHGTMLPEDLIPRFMEVLDDIRELIALPKSSLETAEETEARKGDVQRLDSLLGGIEQAMEADGYYDSEDATYDLYSLCVTLNEYAPEGHYFGSHPGDGADYGFWEFDNDD